MGAGGSERWQQIVWGPFIGGCRAEGFVEGDAIVIRRLLHADGQAAERTDVCRSSEGRILNMTKWLQVHEYAGPLLGFTSRKNGFVWWFSEVLFKHFCL